MSVDVTPPGTRGTAIPRLPGPLMSGLGRLFTAMFRTFGRRMRVAGRPLLLLTTVGAKSGRERQAVLGWWPDEDAGDGSVWVVGSRGGSARHPAWFLNMARHPDRVWIERDRRRIQVTPESLRGEERAAAWRRIVADAAQYGKYQVNTDREIPVIRLRPLTSADT